MDFKPILESSYREVLRNYLEESSEAALYQGQMFSRKSIKQKISPEEIISIHAFQSILQYLLMQDFA